MYFYRETKIGNFSGKDRFSLSKSERITTDAPTGNKLYYNWIRKCYRKFPESAIFAGVTGKKGRKPVDELTREQGAAQCSYAAWNLVPLSTRPLVNFPSNPNNNEEIIATMAIGACLCSCGGSQKEVYKDSTAPVKDRVEDLLKRMTLEEKVGQMNQFVGVEHIKANSAVMTEEELKNNTANAFYPGFTEKDIEKWTEEGLIGSFLHVLTIEEANYLQSLAMKSRLQIPIIFGIDAIHGNANAPDNTVYPTNINLACSFDTLMAYKIARQTAKEMRAMNMHWTFNPNVEVARDARWGRVGETYGEDPYLVTLLGVQSVKGYQGDLNGNEDVLACIKHFVGGSEPINGTNGSPTDLSERTLREVFFPPFEAGVKAGAMSLMTAHNELNGIPCHSNEWLMQDILRGEWNFPGFVVSDWMDIEHIHDLHATAENLKEAFISLLWEVWTCTCMVSTGTNGSGISEGGAYPRIPY